MTLQAPFPWFGGKRKVAHVVWRRFGAVQNFVEPFFGSGAVLLGRPEPWATETINDLDGFVANFWRAVKLSPETTAAYADNPVNENDLHARHAWLLGQRENLAARLEGDPDFHDAKIAGWWVWGICSWIGSGWCSGNGPWQVRDGKLVHLGDQGRGVKRKLVHLCDQGLGVNRQLVHLGNQGLGVNRKRVHLGNQGLGVNRKRELHGWLGALSTRLERVRVCSGDWSRVCGPSVTWKHGLTGVFLDPPYSAERAADLYREDSNDVAVAVREWALEAGARPDMRVALCGYDGEHDMPGWSVHVWKAGDGFGGQAEERTGNGRKERIWFSPACVGERNVWEVRA